MAFSPQEIPEEVTITVKTMGDSVGETFLVSLDRRETALMMKHLSTLPGMTQQQRKTLLGYLFRKWGLRLSTAVAVTSPAVPTLRMASPRSAGTFRR